MKTKPAYLAAAALLTLTLSAPAALFTLTTPTQDAFVSAANPTNNYGGAGAVGVSAAGLAKGEFDSLLQFDFALAKASFDSTFGAGLWTIDKISLQLMATSPGNPIFNASAAGSFAVKWMQNDSWVEGTGNPGAPGATGINFSTLPSFLSGSDQSLGSFAFGGGTSGAFSWDLGLASSFLADATAGNTVSLLMLPDDSAVSMLVNSRTGPGGPSVRPMLIIEAVPEPAMGGFAACLALAALGVRRRYRVQAA